MRRATAMLMVMCLTGSFAPSLARADDDDRRTRTARYVASAGASAAPSLYWADSPIGNIGGAEFRLKNDEHFIEVRVSDGSGLDVHGEIGADLDGIEQTSETIAEFCGRTEAPIELPDVDSVRVIVRSGSCDGGPALATSGRMKVKLSGNP